MLSPEWENWITPSKTEGVPQKESMEGESIRAGGLGSSKKTLSAAYDMVDGLMKHRSEHGSAETYTRK